MIIKQISDVILSFEKQGRNRTTDKTYSRADIAQMVRMGYNNSAVQRYWQAKKMGAGDDYYFYSGLLSIQRFPLGDPDLRNMRILDMAGIEIFRLPKNDNFTNVYPIGDCQGDSTTWNITQVSPGEEKFYLSPDFEDYKFYSVKASSLHMYNIPTCVKEIDVETTFDNHDDEVDIPMDIAFEVAFQILGWELKIKQFRTAGATDSPYNTPSGADLRRRLEGEAQQPG
jgi:hypothetical protein